MKRNHLAWIIACLLPTAMAGVANAQGTSIAFVTQADTLTGTVTHYNASNTQISQEQISPQAQATTDSNGSDTESASTNSGTASGIHVYDITNGQNSSTGCDSSGCDQTTATAGTSTVSFLGGLVNINVQTTTLTGVADSTNPNQVDITADSVTAATVGGTGISVAQGTYAGGTSFPVSGSVTVPVLDAQGNPTGDTQNEPFTGQLTVAKVLQGSDPTSGASVFSFTAEQLTGKVSDGSGGYYAITLGGPQTPPSPGNGNGPIYSVASAPTFKVSG